MLQQLYATTKQGKWSVGGPVLVWNIMTSVLLALWALGLVGKRIIINFRTPLVIIYVDMTLPHQHVPLFLV